jgi:plasmid stabilization system protein ParE
MIQKISRRALGLAAIGTAAYPQSEPAKKYGGALEGSESKVDLREFDPVAWTLDRYQAAPLRLTFRATTRKQAEAWQRELRAKLAELLGGFPESRSSLRQQTLEVHEFPDYRREKFIYQSRPGSNVLAYLITPASAKSPMPVIICIPGHGRGVDDIVGIDESGKDRTGKPGYQHDFALQVAERGMAALAIEPLAFGCRRDSITIQKGLSNTACQPSAGSALLLGETMIGWRVYDVMRAIDWIETRPALAARV